MTVIRTDVNQIFGYYTIDDLADYYPELYNGISIDIDSEEITKDGVDIIRDEVAELP